MYSAENVIEYYDIKKSEYNEKYGCGNFTHIHTGLYSKELFPLLYSSDNLENLGIDKIRNYLHIGQELLVSDMIQDIRNNSHRKENRILDCGAGHGAASIMVNNCLKDSFVTALTISETQAREIKKNAEKQGTSKNLDILVQNVINLKSKTLFNCIFGIEAFCQMGDPHRLLRVLNKNLERDGYIIVSDIFLQNKGCEFEDYFNKHWKSEINPVKEFVKAAIGNGFIIENLENRSHLQLPFWKLSSSYCSVMLMNTEDEYKTGRLQKTRQFHNSMIKAYENDDIGYYKIILKKVSEIDE